ncbi:MAG: hypothetical protein BWK76_11930 [Desulfobulbaceae bacterium A2]|nr:MAG: hypothetical protein BWK76_11930 [Desulfobulbaceae bacterium A2]
MKKIFRPQGIIPFLCFLSLIFSSLLFCIVTANATETEDLIDLAIVLDRSGSMKQTDPQALSIPAAAYILEHLALANEKNRAVVIPFNNHASVLGQESASPGNVLSRNLPALIEMLRIASSKEPQQFREMNVQDSGKMMQLIRDQMTERGETELDDALQLAARILRADEPQRRKLVVLISDGEPWPNLKDDQRRKELTALAGKELVDQARFDTTARQRLNIKFADHILNTTVATLANQTIKVYPVAFLPADQPNARLITFLEDIKEKTTGDRKIVSATPNDLVEKLGDFLPTTSQHIQLYSHKGQDSRFIRPEEALGAKEQKLIIPNIASELRFFLSYPGARKDHAVNVEFFRDGKLVASSHSPSSNACIVNEFRRRDGALAFHSVRILQAQQVPGTWLVKVTDTSPSGSAHLPATDLIVDVRASAAPEITVETQSGQLNAEEPATVRCKLLGHSASGPQLLPILEIDAFLVGRNPEKIRNINEKIRNFTIQDSQAIAEFPDGISQSGYYELSGRITFATVPPSRPLTLRFEKQLDVQPGPPVNAWLGKRGTPQSLQRAEDPLIFTLPALGEKFSTVFDGVEVETDAQRPLNNLIVTSEQFTHKESAQTLPRQWIQLEPKLIKKLSIAHPVPLQLTVNLPDNIPPTVSDGQYEAQLRLNQGIRELHTATIVLGLSVPRFVHNPGRVNVPFLGEDKEPLVTVEHVIRYPGKHRRHVVIPVMSTALAPVTAKGGFELAEGMEYKSTATGLPSQAASRNDRVLYQAGPAVEVPGKNSSSAGKMSVQVTLLDASLNNRSFENVLNITGPKHRDWPVRVVTHIRFIPAWWLQCLALPLLALIGLLVSRGLGYWNNRHLFAGREVNDLMDNYAVRCNRRPLANFSYDTDRHQLRVINTGNEEIRVCPPGAGPEDDQLHRMLAPGAEYVPKLGDTIDLSEPGSRSPFALLLTQTPEPATGLAGYGFSVISSRLGSGNILYGLGAGAAMLASLAMVLVVWPYAVLRLLPL